MTEKDKTLHEIIDWCTDRANELCNDTKGDYYAQFCQVDALSWVIHHCESMLTAAESNTLN